MAEEKNEDQKRKSGSGGRKLLIVGLVVGLLLGGGGAGGYFLLTGDDDATATAASPPEEQAKAPPKTAFIKLDHLSAPLVSDGRVLGYVLLDLSLEVKKTEDELHVVQRLPALRAAFLRDVTNTPIGKPDQPMMIDYVGLTNRLRDLANHELGKDAVVRILVTQSTRL